MARIVIASTMVRFPLGGMNNWMLAWLVGFHQLGHEVYLVEKSTWPDDCYDPSRDVSSDDCSYGVTTVGTLLRRFGLEGRWCFVDAAGQYHGLSRERVEAVFRSSDIFLDFECEAWLAEAQGAALRVFVDGEPGWFQMKMQRALAAGAAAPEYDFYYTTGANIGTDRSTAPTAGKRWNPILSPVNVHLARVEPAAPDGPFTTVMQWRHHEPVEFDGVTYGQKDVEFARFMALPTRTAVPLEVAVSGEHVPWQRLRENGWRVRQAMDVTTTIDSYLAYIRASRGEFSVCKNVFVATNSGWFSERSGCYLAHGRPVVLQETGFSAHLPTGRGLFAVRTPDEAAEALREIESDYDRHAACARDLALEYLDARTVLGRFLRELGF